MPVSPSLSLRNRSAGRIRPALDVLQGVLADLGNPQCEFPSILVVGTNGKGSTTAIVESLLRAHGLLTGLYTSPHLVRVEERIRVGGRNVDSAVLEKQLIELEIFPDLTFFETLTAAAFRIFANEGVDVAVLEAGMGGSWDATRLAESTIAGLTNVGSDHARWLGRELSEIAKDKGRALAAAERAVFSSSMTPRTISDLEAPAAVRAETLVQARKAPDGRILLSWDAAEAVVRFPLAGDHQIENLELGMALASEAVAAGLLPHLKPESVCWAVEQLSWPGRLSAHILNGRTLLVDCAHNLEAIHALVRELSNRPERYNLLFSCLDDKPVEAMAKALRPVVHHVAVCPLLDERAMPLDRLVRAFPGALKMDSSLAAFDKLADPVIAVGSLRLVGELFANLSEENIPTW